MLVAVRARPPNEREKAAASAECLSFEAHFGRRQWRGLRRDQLASVGLGDTAYWSPCTGHQKRHQVWQTTQNDIGWDMFIPAWGGGVSLGAGDLNPGVVGNSSPGIYFRSDPNVFQIDWIDNGCSWLY